MENVCSKKMMQKQAEYEEQIEIMLTKLSQLEKAKSRLQSEVEVLIVDLEKVHIPHCPTIWQTR
jgi:hypothetical protein